MAIRFATIAAAALFGAIPASAQDADAPPEPAAVPAIDTLAVDRDRYERITVPVTIAGQGPWRFLIDTGAQATVVTKQIADALQIQPTGTARLVAMGSSRQVQTVELDEFEFANRNISGLTSPLLESAHIGADGILGLDLLQNMRVLIDFKDQRMQVADSAEAGGSRGFEIVVKARRRLGQMIITDARVDGIRTTVIIDTGAQNSVANRALFERLRRRHGQEIVSKDVHGVEMRSDLAVIRRMLLGRMQLNALTVGHTESPAFAALGIDNQPALILGMANLRMFDRIAIDFASQQVLFDMPAAGRAAPLHQLLFVPAAIPS